MSALRGARVHRVRRVRRVVETFRRDGRVEVRFSRLMVGVYLVLGLLLITSGLALLGMVLGLLSPGTGTVHHSDAVMGSVFALVGLFLLGLGIGQARPADPPVVADTDGVHVQGKCIPWPVISGFGTASQGSSANNSHLVATVLVDESTVEAWAEQRRSAGGRRSRLYAPGVIGSQGICLPYNLAVSATALSEALETIRTDVATRDGHRSNR